MAHLREVFGLHYNLNWYLEMVLYANQGFKCKWAVGTLATHADEPLIRILY